MNNENQNNFQNQNPQSYGSDTLNTEINQSTSNNQMNMAQNMNQQVPPVNGQYQQPLQQPQMQSFNQNQMSGQFNYETPKKTNKTFFIIVGILGVIILGLIIYIVIDGRTDSTSEEITNSNNTSENTNVSNNTTNTTNNQTSGSVIKLEGYEFTVPEGYISKEMNGNQAIIDQTNRIGAAIMVTKNVLYSSLVSNQETLKTTLESKGATVTDYKEKTFNGKKWLVYTYTLEGSQYEYSFSELSSTDIIEVDVYNDNNSSSNEQIYNALTTMINNAKNTNASSFAKSKKKNTDVKISGKIEKIDSSIFE